MLGTLDNPPPWWPNFQPPQFSEEELREIEGYCQKIVENYEREKITPWERWKITHELGIPDRPFIWHHSLNTCAGRVLDCWSKSLKPGYDLWFYPKLALKAHLLWNARFNADCVATWGFTRGEIGWGGSSRIRLHPYLQPITVEPILRSPKDWDRIHEPDPYRDGFYPQYLWEVRKIKEFMKKYGIAKYAPLFASIGDDPVNFVSFILGEKGGAGYRAFRKRPELVQRCAELDLNFKIKLGKALIKEGADVLTCIGLGGIAGLEAWGPFNKYWIELNRALTPSGMTWMMLTDQSQVLEYMFETGAIPTRFWVDHLTPSDFVAKVSRKWKKVFALSLDPQLLVHGPSDQLVETVKNTIKTCAGPGFIFGLNICNYNSQAEYIDMASKTAEEYGKKVYTNSPKV